MKVIMGVNLKKVLFFVLLLFSIDIIKNSIMGVCIGACAKV